MDPLGVNKWAAAIIVGLLLIMVIRSLNETMFHEEPGELAYSVEVAAADNASVVVEDTGPTFAELLAMGNADKGAREFAKCKSCHSIESGGKNGTGPNLYDLIDRPLASVDGFRYSSALAAKGGTWDYATLDAWLASPKATVPGTSMSFAGIRKAPSRANLIAYLRGFADTPVALPTVDAVMDAVVEVVEEAANH